MGNCLGKQSKSKSGGGQRLGGAPQPGAPMHGSTANTTSSNSIPMAKLNASNGSRLANPSSSSLPSGDSEEARRLRAQAAERRAAQNNQRGVASSGGGTLAAKLQAERQTSDRELLKRDAEANVAARNNSQAGLNWVVDS